MKPTAELVKEYFRKGSLPTSFCPGCGGGIALGAFVRAVEELKLDKKKIVAVAGIGCSSWLPSPHLDVDTMHITHGRAIPAATAIKLCKPELKVVVFTGDGDGLGIGGNHLIHAARRNVPILVLCINNYVYGMTGGQAAPTTPAGSITATTPKGSGEKPLDACRLVKAASADYVARWTVFHSRQLVSSMAKALENDDGFSFIEVLSQCPSYYGRRNKMPSPVEAMRRFSKLKEVGEF